jgi:hypothetical protein
VCTPEAAREDRWFVLERAKYGALESLLVTPPEEEEEEKEEEVEQEEEETQEE